MRHPHLLLVGLSFVGLLGCDLLTPTIDADLAAGLVESILTSEGIKPSAVVCPEKQKAEKGHKFECTATCEGVEVHFSMEVLDDKGTVVASPRDHTLVVSQTEPEIAEDLQARGHEVESIDCHGDVWVAVKGAEVTCDVTDEAGVVYLWSATFTDDEGSHEHSIAPK